MGMGARSRRTELRTACRSYLWLVCRQELAEIGRATRRRRSESGPVHVNLVPKASLHESALPSFLAQPSFCVHMLALRDWLWLVASSGMGPRPTRVETTTTMSLSTPRFNYCNARIRKKESSSFQQNAAATCARPGRGMAVLFSVQGAACVSQARHHILKASPRMSKRKTSLFMFFDRGFIVIQSYRNSYLVDQM